MTTKIFEELPSRDNRPASAGAERSGPTNMKEKMEKKVRQAVYDIRYRARREGVDIKQAYSQYMQNSSLNGQERNMVKAKIFGTGMREDYNIEEFASNSVANALFKVFVEGIEKEEPVLDLQELKAGYVKKEIGRVDSQSGVGRYKVRVTDKNGTSYVRYATREKISDLRANPNIESVEMTGYGEPYEGERTRGDRTAAAKAGKDYDGDGKVESGAKEHAGSVHNAIQRKKGGVPDGKDTSSVKEDVDFIEEDFIEEKKNSKKGGKYYNVMRGKNTDRVKLFPEVGKSYNEEFFPESAVSTAQQKFMGMVHAYKKGEMSNASPEVKKTAKEMSDTEAKKFASTKHEGLPQHVKKKVQEETACDSSEPQKDKRGEYAKINLIKNKLRSGLGVKNPIVMVSNEEDVKEGAGLSVGISKAVGNLLSNPRTSPEQGAKNFQKNFADPVGNAVKGAVRAVVQPANMSPEAQKARNNKYRPEEVELEGEMIDERRREDKGTTRSPRDRAVEFVRSRNKEGMMTGSGKTLAQHEKERGVKKDRTSEVKPEPPANPPAKKLAGKKAEAERQRKIGREMQSSRFD
jgi:hypothetical protein